MNPITGAWLAAAAGCATGAIDAYIRQRTPPRAAVITSSLLGALFGAMAYSLFLGFGYAVALLMFSGDPDASLALLCVILGCACFLVLRGLEQLIASRFGLPEKRHPSQRRNFGDLLEARPRGGFPTRWLAGVGLALLPVFYGTRCIVTRQGELGTLIWPSEVHGGAAIALGLGWIGVGLFLHFHFFFGLHPTLKPHSRRGKYLSMIVACVGLTVAGAWSVFARVP